MEIRKIERAMERAVTAAQTLPIDKEFSQQLNEGMSLLNVIRKHCVIINPSITLAEIMKEAGIKNE